MKPRHCDGYLRRLADSFYIGNAYVHWSMTIKDRRTGWLNDPFHARFRELLLHTLHRYLLIAPAYCLMPDHIHLFLIGLHPSSHQLRATRFLRRGLNNVLAKSGNAFQKQAFDNVLRRRDRERGAVNSLIWYITENPVRARLVNCAEDWPYSGSLAIGHPGLDVRAVDFHETLWRIIETEMKAHDWTSQRPVAEECSSSEPAG